ncbi:hypothetical protein GCM10009096_09510 [Parasphingorhabdus litoris]|uniref:DUF4893 domain-containing protein n=1 Tax=Parasphingorhabdus litoris TaxID=394733 RepID=A0ABN1A932_9SPHN|nr:DUF4893 domain-containing protein [Parasphingorhabdus litoris]
MTGIRRNVIVAMLASAGLSPTAAAKDNAHPESQWREMATQADEKRLDDWQGALRKGRTGAAEGGEESKLDARKPLFEEEAALPDSKIPAGLYSCSVTKLDGDASGGLPYIAYPAFRCRVTVDGDRRHFTKLTGSQRTAGWLYEAGSRHSIYLGTSFYGYEDKAVSYGKTEKRDQAAVVQRIGSKRWRMVFPYPYYESVVNVMELTPIPE